MNTPLLSISCTTYNHEKFIGKCLEGFLMQKTNFSYEILINDDASSDKTSEIIREYANQYDCIKPLYQDQNQWSRGQRGMNVKFNLLRAKGKYIAICEGDDYWTDPMKLQKQVDFLETHDDYVLTYHDADYVDSEGQLLHKGKLSPKFRRDMNTFELQTNAYVLTLTMVFRNVIKNYPEEVFSVYNADKFLTSLLGAFGNGKYMATVEPAAYRVHEGGVWSHLKKEQKLKVQFKTYEELYLYYKRIDNKEVANYFYNKLKNVFKMLLLKYLRGFQLKSFTQLLLNNFGKIELNLRNSSI